MFLASTMDTTQPPPCSRAEVIAAVQEERLTGVKNQGGLPREAIGDVLSAGSGTLSQIEKLALNGNYMTYDHWDREGASHVRRMRDRGPGQSSP